MEEREVRLLDINVSNQIAAGEVVEKPASVVKELVENALDAGATSIDVNMTAGGTEYLRVQDNGCGMSEENARMAVKRHATSKLRSAQDLLSLQTLGFRGEALPSIASVSEFELLTRPEGQEFAVSLKINGGVELGCERAGGSVGTTVIVKNLFFNVPARRKFLHTVTTEGRYISELLTRLALTRPDVRFRLTSGEREILATPGVGGLKAAIQELYGKKTAKELLPVKYEEFGVRVEGYIGNPTLYKGNRSWQTLIVNGRVINSMMLSKALQHAYQSMIPKSGFPFAVLNIKVDQRQIDVNVHPQKSEVRFSDESGVYKAVYRALTEALTQPLSAAPAAPAAQQLKEAQSQLKLEAKLQKSSAVENFLHPQIRSEQGCIWKSPGKNAADVSDLDELAAAALNNFGNNVQDEKKLFKREENPDKAESEAVTHTEQCASKTEMQFMRPAQQIFKTTEPLVKVGEAKQDAPTGTLKAVRSAQAEKFSGQLPDQVTRRGVNVLDGYADEPRDNAVRLQASGSTGLDVIWPLGQVDKTFIIAQSETSLFLIDQHAAAERILYDRLVAQHNEIPSQQLLIPLYLDARAQDVEMIERYHDEFLRLGVDIAPGGESTLRVSSLPIDIGDENAEAFVADITEYLRRSSAPPKPSELRQEVLHMAACRGAIKAGEILSPRQMRQLIMELCNTSHPYTCPHGRPCMIELTPDDLYKMFKRTGFNLEENREWET